MPGAGLGGLDGELDVLAQTLAGHAGVDAQLVDDPQPVLGGLIQRAQLYGLDVELGLQDILIGAHRIRVLGDHGHAGQRLTHADLLRLAQRERGGHHLTHLLHRIHQRRVIHQHAAQLGRLSGLRVHQRRPIGQMHGFAAGQAAPHSLGLHRGERGEHAHERLQRGVQRVERVPVLIPEPVAGVADVPVGQQVDVIGHRVACVGDRKLVERLGRRLHQATGAGQQVAVHLGQRGHLVGAQQARVIPGTAVRSVRIQREEIVRAPHRQHDLTHRITDAIGGHDQVAAAQDRRTHQEPTHRIGAVLVEHAVDVRVVAQVLRHLLAVGAEHDAVADHVLVRRLVEQRGGHDVQGVEPAAGLADVLHDVVAREVLLEELLVLERIVELRERHRTGFEPAVEHVGDAAHRGLAGRVVRVRTGQVVDPRAVHVDLALVVARVVAEVGLELLQRAVDVHARICGIVGDPHRNRRTPEAVAGDRPVAGVGQPLAELAVLDVVRDPVDLLVEFKQTVLDLGDGHEPAGDRLVDQRGGAAPAVRIGVHIALLLEQDGAVLLRHGGQRAVAGAQVAQDRQVGVEHEHALILRAQRRERAARVKHVHGRDAVGVQRVHIVLAVGGLVHQAGALGGVHVVGGEDLVGVGARGAALGERVLAREVREDRPVAPADHVGALEFAHNLVALAEFLGVGTKQGLGEVELLAGELALDRLDLHVVDVRADHDREVRGHGPRRGGPEHGVGVVLVLQLDGHGHGGVLTVLVHVGIHAQLVRAQRRLVLRAVRQHAVALIGQTLVVQLLERPHHRFHVRDVQGLVAVLEVDPAGLTVHVVLPFVRVLEHGGAAGVVELGDAHLLDLVHRLDAQLLLRLKLGGQAVGVPAEDAVDLAALHGLVARDHILGVAGQQVAVMRQAVGERRAVEEHELVLAVVAGRVAVDGLLEGIVFVPIVENVGLQLREARVRSDVGALLAGCGLGIHMGMGGFAHRVSPRAGLFRYFYCHEDDGIPGSTVSAPPISATATAVPPRLPHSGCREAPRPVRSRCDRLCPAVSGRPRRFY